MTTLCFIDTETTGLDPRIHQPWEVSIWRTDWTDPWTAILPHTLDFADPAALNIGGWHKRGCGGLMADDGARGRYVPLMADLLNGVTLVGSNPAFDAAMMTRFIGTAVWHHRLINVAEGAMWLFGWDRPKGLADVTAELRERGHDIPEPDHTAEGDVRTTRAVYYALREERGRLS